MCLCCLFLIALGGHKLQLLIALWYCWQLVWSMFWCIFLKLLLIKSYQTQTQKDKHCFCILKLLLIKSYQKDKHFSYIVQLLLIKSSLREGT